MKRRTLLTSLSSVLIVGFAGCTSDTIREPISSNDEHTGTAEGIDGSVFYQSVSTRDTEQSEQSELQVLVNETLNMNEESEQDEVKADALVLLHEGKWIAEQTPVYDKSEYLFNIPGDGMYTLVATGDVIDGGEISQMYEFESILEFQVDRGNVQVDGVYYTKRKVDL